ncbi:hypothetical protein G8A07_24645 [Roseateles sp. DAIF2]|uniref:hypothetical protein n=1 Tax=Roseateles sp. DAIF2 TaxID=2714952 RepID=UPI0018A2A0B3|nr:hypothetical protein [Roseateles sp. DAIF2]QPF75790.1 hypothetical protein G8A07_24645 [Roseateles sp. DAIF2]
MATMPTSASSVPQLELPGFGAAEARRPCALDMLTRGRNDATASASVGMVRLPHALILSHQGATHHQREQYWSATSSSANIH